MIQPTLPHLPSRTARLASPHAFLCALLALFALSLPSLAAQASERAALAITGIQPSIVSASASATLSISGADFVDGATVELENYGNLTTTFINSGLLTAMLPAGLTPGGYTVKVVNPDGSSVALPNALQVDVATATQPFQGGDSATPTPYQRPLVVVESYNFGSGNVTPAQEVELVIKLSNIGERKATNVVLTFTPGDFVPRESGGVVALDVLEAGDTRKAHQALTVSYDVIGKFFATAVVQVAYTDTNGVTYTETFNLTAPVRPAGARPATATPTPTPTTAPSLRPQLVITGYESDVEILQPGSLFRLQLHLSNVGTSDARRVTMILGGGSSSSGGQSGTPDPGGVSGSSGDFGNFAPVAASNVQFLGDLATGGVLNPQASLIVNASTNPGAYPMKISFTYLNEKGITYTDDQVVTLLVYSPPQVEVNFYRDPGPLFAGQPNQIPLQVVNLGRKATVLGNMKVNAEGAEVSNNTTLVGPLDSGGYFTLDAMLVPPQPGPLNLNISLAYTDDFNQPAVITKTLTLEIMESQGLGPGASGEPGTSNGGEGSLGPGGVTGPEVGPAVTSETFMQKLVRFVKGLIGLDSAPPASGPGEPLPGEIPPDKGVPAPAVAPGKG